MSLLWEAKETLEVPERKKKEFIDLKKIMEMKKTEQKKADEEKKKADEEKKKKEEEQKKESEKKKVDIEMEDKEKEMKEDNEVGPAPKKLRPYVSQLVAGGRLHKVVTFGCICLLKTWG